MERFVFPKYLFSRLISLGKFLVLDLTSQGSLYRDRFLSTHGHDTMLYFDFFKYGDAVEASKEPHDARLKIRMASVIYVHTQRFYSELLAFFNHFHQHQNVMNRIREAAMGSDVSEVASRGTRIHLDIEAGSPLLLLPGNVYILPISQMNSRKKYQKILLL